MAKVGRPKGSTTKPWSDALRLALNREAKMEDGTMVRYLDLVAMRCVKAAVSGDMNAIREIGDRMDGRPNVTIDATVTKREIHEYSDEELAALIASAAQAADAAGPTDEEPKQVH